MPVWTPGSSLRSVLGDKGTGVAMAYSVPRNALQKYATEQVAASRFACPEYAMRARLTAGNRLTLPRAALAAVGPAEFFDITVENGRLVLTPVRTSRADAARAKLAGLGLSEGYVGDAVKWARLER